MAEEKQQGDDFPWHLGVFDAHCHPTDTMSSIALIAKMQARGLTIMATRAQDQDLVRDVAKMQSPSAVDMSQSQIIPSFGWHPWFSHQLYNDFGTSSEGEPLRSREQKIAHYQKVLTPESKDEDFLASLPDPQPLSAFVDATEKRLSQFPYAMVGEVGLDKAFRLPEDWLPGEIDLRNDSLTPGGREGRQLSPYRVDMDHQKTVLISQLQLAGRLRRAVSCHGVQAHGILYEAIRELWKGRERPVESKRSGKREQARDVTTGDAAAGEPKSQMLPYPPRLCLHSYSGPPDTAKLYLRPSVPVDFYFSFSTAINFSSGDSSAAKARDVIHELPVDRILVESDLHVAGDRMDQHLKEIVHIICDIRDWTLAEGVTQLARNWRDFTFGQQQGESA